MATTMTCLIYHTIARDVMICGNTLLCELKTHILSNTHIYLWIKRKLPSGKVRISVTGGISLRTDICLEREAVIPRPGMAETYGCPIWNSAKLKHTCNKNLKYPPPHLKKLPNGLIIHKKRYHLLQFLPYKNECKSRFCQIFNCFCLTYLPIY